jgi:predicted HAD superfamily Cof-like phosphohydrolase
MVEDIAAFHQRFGLRGPRAPQLLPNQELVDFRQGFMQEELNEFMDAHAAGDLAEAADALIDLVYVAMGTAHMMGLPWDELWADVQRANMAKVRAESADQSKRGTTYDVVKPAGWVPPQGARILERFTAKVKREMEQEDNTEQHPLAL